VSDAIDVTRSLPQAPRAQYRRGALLVAGAAVTWSSAGVLARTIAADGWTMLFWRSVFAGLFVLAYIGLREGRAGYAAFRRLDRTGWGVALTFALSSFCFILALEETAVANVIVFQAAAPFIAAILGWAWLGERLSGAGLAAILASLVGILVMVSDSVGTGRILGNMLSLVMGTSFAVMIVLARRRRDVPMTAATCVATALLALVTLPFASLALASSDLLLMALFGIGQMGLGLIMFMAGVRLMPAADAGLISTLEVILMPFWVWLAYGENPGTRALAGGAIVLAAVIANTLFERARGASAP